MNILILGGGGREHTLAWKLKQSPLTKNLYVAPGNGGTAALGENLPLKVSDFQGIKSEVLAKAINMVVVGPEDPLVLGIHDFFLNDPDLEQIPVIGPQKAAAMLEGSKEFAKDFMSRHGIPTAAYQSFTLNELDQGIRFLEATAPPYVLKADGLAAGKGVLILDNLEEAKAELKNMLEGKFGNASTKVVIEQFLKGIELSCFVLTDGEHYKVLPSAKDYKRIGEGDTGLNTGGMGAVSPVPFADTTFIDKVHEKIIKPTVQGLKKDNLPYKGFIFIGLIKIAEEPYVIEYNVRMGDPETEVVIPRIKNDLVTLFKAVADQELHEIGLEIDERTAATVMAVSGGYPQAYEKGKQITGLDTVQDATVFQAGTILDKNKTMTNGGRVLAVTGYGNNHKEALQKSYDNLKKVTFEGMYYRRDIGFDL